MAFPNLSEDGGDDLLFALFHENSKIGRRTCRDPRREAAERPSLLPLDAPVVDLTDDATPLAGDGEGIRRSAIGRILAAASGADDRALEFYLHARAVAGLPPGLYRHDPAAPRAVLVASGDHSATITAALLDPPAASPPDAALFIVADFAPLVSRFGERGYRYALIAAGAAVSDMSRAAQSAGLSADGTGEFRDRDIDRLLRLDGVERSTLYMVRLGAGTGPPPAEPARIGGARLGRRRRRRGRR